MCESEARWVSRLHTALEENLYTLLAQLIILLNTRKFYATHYEWLRRLKDDDQTLIYPDSFLPAAALYNLLPAINRRVFGKTFDRLNKNGHCSRVTEFQ